MKNREIETKTAKIILIEDGFIRYNVLPGVEVTLEDTKEYVRIPTELTKGKKLLNLTDLREVKSITREARDYLAGEEATKITTACALLISSPLSKVVGNIFLGLNRPTYPTKLFTSEEKAIAWLREFVNNEESKLYDNEKRKK